MKWILILLTLLLGWATIHAQQGYRYGDKLIKLTPQDEVFFIKTKNTETNSTFTNRMIRQLGRNVLKYSLKKAPNQYIVRAKGKIETDQDYISNIYKSEGNEPIIVLPRIVLVLNEGRTITPILRRFRLAYLFMANPLTFNLKKRRKATQGLSPFFNSLLFFFSQV